MNMVMFKLKESHLEQYERIKDWEIAFRCADEDVMNFSRNKYVICYKRSPFCNSSGLIYNELNDLYDEVHKMFRIIE